MNLISAPIAKSERDKPKISSKSGAKLAICELALAIKLVTKSFGNCIILTAIYHK